ncbi:MAG: PD-(D/E)XK nuclease family protein [bacterium]
MPSAGEVEQFAYCAHNWFLARHGQTGAGAGSERGVREHGRLGAAQNAIERQKAEYKSGLAWSFRVLAFAGSVSFLGLELVFLAQTPFHLMFLVTALFLVSISAALLIVALVAQRNYESGERSENLVPGLVLDSDLAGGGRVLEDPSWNLSGKPDYILKTEGGPVPVEVKTGRTPPKPFPSHALQVGCYLRLIEVTSGKAPAYGLLNYPDGVFRIAWDDKLRADLEQTLGRIAQAERAGKADRDHEQAGRCRGCSRREACDQRLA